MFIMTTEKGQRTMLKLEKLRYPAKNQANHGRHTKLLTLRMEKRKKFDILKWTAKVRRTEKMAATSPLIERKKNKVKMKILDLLPKVGCQI